MVSCYEVFNVQYCAGELGHLLDAEDFVSAHKLLISHLAPKWFIAGDKYKTDLQDVLTQLAPHRSIIEAKDGVNAFINGAGLYIAYQELQVIDWQSLVVRRTKSRCILATYKICVAVNVI